MAFDRDGAERRDHPDGQDGLMSPRVIAALVERPPTDLFLFAHGWKHDVPAAIAHYERWLGAMTACHADLQRAERRSGGFCPLWVGLHWPSQPWGDEALERRLDDPDTRQAVVDAYAERLGGAPLIRDAIETIVRAAAEQPVAARLPRDVAQAYEQLDRALALGADGPAGAPGDDREPFDPEAAFAAGATIAEVPSSGAADLLGPLRQLSFWTMKKRALVVGERGMHDLLVAVREAADRGARERPARIHVLGHSFGGIAASAMVTGPPGPHPEVRRPDVPVHSLVLVQGAMSLWSFAPRIPVEPSRRGYFHRLVAGGLVQGPIVTTRSAHDVALGRFYRLAAGLGRDLEVVLPEYPRYGALGAFGARGLGGGVVDQPMLSMAEDYQFAPSAVYNLDASAYIKEGSGLAGAHSDIFGAEVAHAAWQAATVP